MAESGNATANPVPRKPALARAISVPPFGRVRQRLYAYTTPEAGFELKASPSECSCAGLTPAQGLPARSDRGLVGSATVQVDDGGG